MACCSPWAASVRKMVMGIVSRAVELDITMRALPPKPIMPAGSHAQACQQSCLLQQAGPDATASQHEMCTMARSSGRPCR